MRATEQLPSSLGLPYEKRDLIITRVMGTWYVRYGQHAHHKQTSGATLEQAASRMLENLQ